MNLLNGPYGRHLFPFAKLLRQPSIEYTCDSISGWFGRLPIELIRAIVTAMLELEHPAQRDDVIASVRCVQSFVRTCRGASLVVTREQRMEGMARRYLQLAPLPGVVADCAYTELSYVNFRSAIESQLVLEAILTGVTHCACLTNACCRSGRARLNNTLRLMTARGNCPSNIIAQKVLGSHRESMCVSVAAGRNASLLCHTDRGAAVCVGDLVRCIEGVVCDVYSAEGELAITFERRIDPEIGAVTMAASSGDMLVLFLSNPNHAQSGKWQALQVWDTKSNMLLDSRRVKHSPTLLWVCDQTVYCLTTSNVPDLFTTTAQQRPIIDRWQPRAREESMKRKGRRWTLPTCGQIVSVSVARHAGHLVMVDKHTGRSKEHILFFDVALGQVGSIDCHTALTILGDSSTVALSPMADTAVFVSRSLDNPAVFVYRRKQQQLHSGRVCIGVDEPMGWSMCFHGNPSHSAFHLTRLYTQYTTFSPCGGEVCCIFSSQYDAKFLRVNVSKTLQDGKVTAEFYDVSTSVVPTKVVWSDGVYLQTKLGNGIIRIGST